MEIQFDKRGNLIPHQPIEITLDDFEYHFVKHYRSDSFFKNEK